MKIVLCFMPMPLYESKFELLEIPPMVLYLLYAVLKAKGFCVTVVDPYEFLAFEDTESDEEFMMACFGYIKSKISDDDIICFSSNSFNWGISKEMANKISANNQKQQIIFGGLHPTIFDEHALKVTSASIVVRGEGEKKLPEVIDAIINKKPLSEIKSITYRNNNKIVRNPDEAYLTIEELEASPLPDFSVIPTTAKYKYLPVEASRGCKFNCAFCSITHRSIWRGVSVDVLECKVDDIMKFSPESDIIFMDDCFTTDTKRTKEIVFRIKEHLTNSKIIFEVRAADVLKDDLFDSIDGNVVKWFQVGVECGYNEGLSSLKILIYDSGRKGIDKSKKAWNPYRKG